MVVVDFQQEVKTQTVLVYSYNNFITRLSVMRNKIPVIKVNTSNSLYLSILHELANHV